MSTFVLKNIDANNYVFVKKNNEEYHLFKMSPLGFENSNQDTIFVNNELFTINNIKSYVVNDKWFQWYIINNPQIEYVKEIDYNLNDENIEIMIECDEYMDTSFMF